MGRFFTYLLSETKFDIVKDNLGLKQAEDEASYTCLGLSRGRITGASSELQNFTLYSKTKRIKKKEK